MLVKLSLTLGQPNIARNPNLQLRNANDFYLPNPRVDSFNNIPLYSFGNEWNNFDDGIKFQYNRTTFKIALKKYLLESLQID